MFLRNIFTVILLYIAYTFYYTYKTLFIHQRMYMQYNLEEGTWVP